MKLKIFASTVVSCVLMALPAGRAVAGGCTQWYPGPMVSPIVGTNGPVYAMTMWTPPSQTTALMVIGGAFTQVGATEANNIAAWDGQRWRALDHGTNGPVKSLTVFGSQLIVGGEFSSPGRRLAAWNNSTWASLGDFGPPESSGLDGVHALRVFNGELYAAGFFCCVNGVPNFSNCAKYLGGTNWQEAAGMVGVIRALEVFDQDGAGPVLPMLYIGGESFSPGHSPLRRSVDGVNASNVTGPQGVVDCLAVADNVGLSSDPGGLVVGGQFQNWLNGGSPTLVRNIARFDGTTGHAIGGGMGDASERIRAVRAYKTELMAGGTFDDVGSQNQPVYHIARFNGAGWQSMPPNFGGGMAGSSVNALGIRPILGGGESELIVCGDFTGVWLVLSSANVVRYHNNTQWAVFEETPHVHALAVLGTRAIIGGEFSQTVEASAGGALRNPWNIMTWDGVTKSSLGLGANGLVRSLLAYTTGSGPSLASVVIAAGDFTTVYGNGLDPAAPIGANRIAQWTESSFGLPMWSNMGSGFDASVNALERFVGNVVAGGAFSWTGLTNINRLAKWAGSPPSWQPLTTPAPDFNGPVHALKAFTDNLGGTDSYLVIAGAFTSAPGTGVAASRIVLRRESPIAGQSAWQALGAGFNNTVYAVERHGSGLTPFTYAAGDFTASGATPLNRIARLSGANWVAVGNGIGFNGTVRALKSSGGFLYAAGDFTSVDGIAANRVARWNGTAWSAVDGGLAGGPVGSVIAARALAAYRGEVLAGGSFQHIANAPTVPSQALARFSPTNIPWIAKQPAATTIACGASASIAVIPAPGYIGLTYSWRRNGVAVVNGPTPHGSTIVGAAAPVLQISNSQPEDAGSYDCIITSACGNVTSTAATLTVNGSCCPADINSDGLVNVTDLLAVIGAWGACATPPCAADINSDNQINVTDLLAVIGAWGACP